jgi:hypothetical protein
MLLSLVSWHPQGDLVKRKKLEAASSVSDFFGEIIFKDFWINKSCFFFTPTKFAA